MSGTLKRINGKDIAKIASGQVIVDLKSVIKELVENALDAKATSIDIKIVNYGADLIEVSDNGTGIQRDDFAGIALKYYTSKIESFNDINSISSFGFRGEALSCICELSGEFSVVTRHQSMKVGSYIKYNSNGTISEQRDQARTIGTTVSIKNLFEHLPVRRKAYMKSCKTHLSNMITLVQSYAVSCLGVRIGLSHRIPSTGKTITLLSVPANYSIKQRIQTIFGSQISSTLSEFSSSFLIPRKPSQEETSLSDSSISTSMQNSVLSVDSPSTQYKFESKCNWAYQLPEEDCDIHGYITGFISRVGSSTNSSDRGNVNLSTKGNQSKQLLFVNNRFVEYKKLIDLFIRVWRDYEPRTMPVLVVNIILPPSYYDINLSIDKKQILFMKEDLLFEAIQEIIHCALDTCNMNMKVSSVSVSESKQKSIADSVYEKKHKEKASSETAPTSREHDSMANSSSTREIHSSSHKEPSEVTVSLSKKREIKSSTISVPSKVTETPSKKRELSILSHDDHSKVIETPSKKRERIKSTLLDQSDSDHCPLSDKKEAMNSLCVSPTSTGLTLAQDDSNPSDPPPNPSQNSDIPSSISQVDSSPLLSPIKQISVEPSTHLKDSSLNEVTPTTSKRTHHCEVIDITSHSSSIAKESIPVVVDRCKKSKKRRDPVNHTIEETFHSKNSSCLENSTAVTPEKFKPYQTIRSSITQQSILKEFNSLSSTSVSLKHPDFATPSHSLSTDEEEANLDHVLQKSSFTEMEVIGQFNNSFIICKLENELYILDQHACDEKYNYETLMNENRIQSQRLIKPISLELSPDQEFVVIHNMNVFVNSGFEVTIEESNPIGSRLHLISLPASKQYTFTVSDFMELVTVVMESGGNVKRTPKLAKILATRACHKSVRAGDPLTHSKMVSIVRSLATLERPWSCPHGRPTLRHLVTLMKNCFCFFNTY